MVAFEPGSVDITTDEALCTEMDDRAGASMLVKGEWDHRDTDSIFLTILQPQPNPGIAAKRNYGISGSNPGQHPTCGRSPGTDDSQIRS